MDDKASNTLQLAHNGLGVFEREGQMLPLLHSPPAPSVKCKGTLHPDIGAPADLVTAKAVLCRYATVRERKGGGGGQEHCWLSCIATYACQESSCSFKLKAHVTANSSYVCISNGPIQYGTCLLLLQLHTVLDAFDLGVLEGSVVLLLLHRQSVCSGL